MLRLSYIFIEVALTKEQAKNYLKTLNSQNEKHEFVMHLYCHNGQMFQCLGISRFTNHSSNPSIEPGEICNGHYNLYASRDILPGDEITEDYSDYESLDFYEDLCKEYNVESASVCAKKYK